METCDRVSPAFSNLFLGWLISIFGPCVDKDDCANWRSDQDQCPPFSAPRLLGGAVARILKLTQKRSGPGCFGSRYSGGEIALIRGRRVVLWVFAVLAGNAQHAVLASSGVLGRVWRKTRDSVTSWWLWWWWWWWWFAGRLPLAIAFVAGCQSSHLPEAAGSTSLLLLQPHLSAGGGSRRLSLGHQEKGPCPGTIFTVTRLDEQTPPRFRGWLPVSPTNSQLLLEPLAWVG
ncbi:hypothetical protein B0T16DRAFT_150391 [Cercophora newfieldiana]|uniref:Uncharacterized protein n=1 Tax=Cercophora newfieldiana TaxID=92897 RepID=A0AA40CQY7_9PEZI|nr:hypothetical protein B0T16DRAFT_150391 [Cercophora newfieldiana]